VPFSSFFCHQKKVPLEAGLYRAVNKIYGTKHLYASKILQSILL